MIGDHLIGNHDLIGITIQSDCDLSDFFPKFPLPVTITLNNHLIQEFLQGKSSL